MNTPLTKQENTYPCACPEGACWKVTKPPIQYCRKEQPLPTDPKIGAPLTSNEMSARESREKELTFVVSALATALDLDDDEQRDALCDLREWAKNRLRAQLPVETKKDGWIPTTARLPPWTEDRHEFVLVYSATHDWQGKRIEVMRSMDFYAYSPGDDEQGTDDARVVTHWMPLPAAPGSPVGKEAQP